jgi:hypothetical protein
VFDHSVGVSGGGESACASGIALGSRVCELGHPSPPPTLPLSAHPPSLLSVAHAVCLGCLRVGIVVLTTPGRLLPRGRPLILGHSGPIAFRPSHRSAGTLLRSSSPPTTVSRSTLPASTARTRNAVCSATPSYRSQCLSTVAPAARARVQMLHCFSSPGPRSSFLRTIFFSLWSVQRCPQETRHAPYVRTQTQATIPQPLEFFAVRSGAVPSSHARPPISQHA